MQPGMLTTVQDLGRVGLMRFGVSPCGALDHAALILGNRLLENEPNEAGLEITLLGPTLVFSGSAFIAVTGADLGPRLNGDALPQWQPVAVGPGDELAFRRSWTPGSGVRAYLSVAGGFAVEPVLDSRSTDLWGHFGGYKGRALRSGDEIRLRGARWSPRAILGRRLANEAPSYVSEMTLRVVLGPQVDRFTVEYRHLSRKYLRGFGEGGPDGGTVAGTRDHAGLRRRSALGRQCPRRRASPR